MKIYISGPMTGLPGLNFPAFNAAAAVLRTSRIEVVNPVEINNGEIHWNTCMRTNIAALVMCNAIFMLEGWQGSKGATLEHYIAETLGMKVIFQQSEGGH